MKLIWCSRSWRWICFPHMRTLLWINLLSSQSCLWYFCQLLGYSSVILDRHPMYNSSLILCFVSDYNVDNDFDNYQYDSFKISWRFLKVLKHLCQLYWNIIGLSHLSGKNPGIKVFPGAYFTRFLPGIYQPCPKPANPGFS